jgi:transcriptional regulator with XRE-family HTH domain
VPAAPLTTAFAQAVRNARRAKGLSQEGAAAEFGIERSHYSKIERAETSPTLETVWKIVQGLGLPPSKLFRAAEKFLDL